MNNICFQVTRGDNFRFAECFICKEQGHIAKQCPDNPRGLYPKGGACTVCGDVTHFKRDCPKHLESQKDEEDVGTMKRSVWSEDLDEEGGLPSGKASGTVSGKKVNKHIKF